MQRIIKIKCKIQNIENAMGDEITPQDYLALLKVTFDHDKKLAEYFKQIGNKEKFTLVNERLPLIVKETEEACAKDPNKDFKKLLAEKATTAAYELDTITGDKANELAEEYGIQDVAPNDHEPDEPELGANPYNHYN